MGAGQGRGDPGPKRAALQQAFLPHQVGFHLPRFGPITEGGEQHLPVFPDTHPRRRTRSSAEQTGSFSRRLLIGDPFFLKTLSLLFSQDPFVLCHSSVCLFSRTVKIFHSLRN